MQTLVKIMLIVGLGFAATFIFINMTGLLSIEIIKGWLEQAKMLSPIFVGSIVTVLLFADLFIAVPTLSVIVLSGYFLGHAYGTFASLSGLMLAGICGYTLSRYLGEYVLRFLVKDELKREEAKVAFRQHGFIMILLSRAVPILPEVTACLAGMTRMTFPKFLTAWSISSIPYVLIGAYAGSISSVENPMPAIFTIIGMSGLLWIGWYFFHRTTKKK